MPRRTTEAQSKTARAIALVKTHNLSFDGAYHLMRDAIVADGNTPTLDPNAPPESELSSDERSRLAEARAALNA